MTFGASSHVKVMSQNDEKTRDESEAGRSDSDPPLVPAIDESAAPELHAELQIPPEILEALKTGDPEMVAQLIRISSSWQGPLPPPEIFKEYPKPVQTTIKDNWLAESQHRRGIETRGQIFGVVIALAAIVAAVVAAIQGQTLVGASIVIATMVGIAATGLIRLFPWKR